MAEPGEAKRQRRASEAQPSENAETQFPQAALAKPPPQARLAGQWAIVHAYPVCHRHALGYTTRALPAGPEQYLARQGNDLLLNMLDSEQPGFFYKEAMIDPTLAFIDEMRAAGANILIHCAQGMSRSPSLALLYLATRLGALPSASLAAAEAQFKLLYPRYTPGYGIWAHLNQHWQAYCADA